MGMLCAFPSLRARSGRARAEQEPERPSERRTRGAVASEASIGYCLDQMGPVSRLTLHYGAALMALTLLACAGNRAREPVPPETQQRSEEMYGRQQRSMESFGQTASEQAGERFENDTRPVRPVDRGKGEGEETR